MRTTRWLVALLACALVFGACQSGSDTESEDAEDESSGVSEIPVPVFPDWVDEVNRICKEIADANAPEPAPQPTRPRTEEEILADFSDAYAALQDEHAQIEVVEIPEDNAEAVEGYLATYRETEEVFGAALESGTVDAFNAELGRVDQQLQELDAVSEDLGLSDCGPKSISAQFAAALADQGFTPEEADCISRAVIEYAARNEIDDPLYVTISTPEVLQEILGDCLTDERIAELNASSGLSHPSR